MGTRLVNGGRILNDGSFESYNKETKAYESSGQKVNKDDFGKSTVGGGVDYSGDNAVVQGITTSYNAANRAKNANKTVTGLETMSANGGGSSDVFASLYKQIGTLQQNLNKVKESEKAANDKLDVGNKLDSIGSSQEGTTVTGTDMTAGGQQNLAESQGFAVDDAVTRAMDSKMQAVLSITQQQMQTLENYGNQFNQYTQQDIASIGRTAERSVSRQLEENDRVKRAMEFAGVLGGRAQFSPIVEESIISDVIREGLDKIDVINEKKNTAIREARKAEATFNIDLFEQQAELAKEYQNEMESYITGLNAHVRQVEQDERVRMEFKQGQEERNALILANELLDADPAKILQTAIANGIDPALLAKATNDAKFEQSNRDFTQKDNALSLQQKEESILSSQNSRRLANAANARAAAGDGADPVKIPTDIEREFIDAGLSRGDAETAWNQMSQFGLDGAVEIWLEGGSSPQQVKNMVSGFARNQRTAKDEEGNLLPTANEDRLYSVIDAWSTTDRKKKIKAIAKKQTIKPTSFFRDI